ncbi:ligand-binding sensor domain-containing diguanylate cyclase [Ahniella affigens]|uniref:ligand-binding sensor domain-containing diguanylate cyclase n=1 Tax=Ahniella affigens TaxID=2021234 RepID=UPI001474F706|nr:GGDEF domain-containing protein [Ahniella affigens]
MTTSLSAVLVGLLLAASGALAQSTLPPELIGAPLVQRYTAEDYQVAPRHLGVTADAEGRIFVGNVEGVLVFSQGRFETITLPSWSAARRLVVGPAGRVYVGAYDHFGYLAEDELGAWQFTDLDARFPKDEAHSLGEVWELLLLGDAVYVLTDERLYRIDGEQADSWLLPGRSHTMFVDQGQLYLRIQSHGLMRFSEGQFTLVPGGELLADVRANLALSLDDGVLIGSRQDALFRFRGGQLTAIKTPLDDWFKRAELYCGLKLQDGSLVIGALNGEVMHLDPDLRLLDRFQASSYPIVALTTDHEGGLWAATDGDLVRAAWPSPWTQITNEDGLLGSIEDSAFFQGRRYVATSMGLFVSNLSPDQRVSFTRLPELGSDEVWDLTTHQGMLLAAHRRGVFVSHGGPFEQIAEGSYASDIVLSRFHPERVYVLHETGILVLQREHDQYRRVASHELPGFGLSSLVEADANTLFLGNFRGDPARATLSPDGSQMLNHQILGDSFGIHVTDGELSTVGLYQGAVVLGIAAGFYRWDGARFVPDNLDGLEADYERRDEFNLRQADDGRQFAFSSRQLFERQPGQGWHRVQISSPLARGFVDVAMEPEGLVSVITWGALLTLDERRSSPDELAPSVSMHRVELIGQRQAVSRLPINSATPINVAPHRQLRFEFGANSAERGIEYRSRLVGFESNFSNFSNANAREFSALPPHVYELRVEARAASGRAFAPLRYRFEVLPRWYQTTWAAWLISGLMLVVGTFLAWVFSRWRSQKLRERNQELERSIESHTRELEVANQRLAKLAVQDGLTGVTNRRGFEQAYARLWNRLAEVRQPLAVLMVDVDFFKQFNDAFGHLAGDEVLRSIARALELHVHEPAEVLARFGGEEFIVLLPNTQIDEALNRAQVLRQACEEAGKANDITVSVGVAVSIPRGGLKPTQLVDEADAALYRAKKAGRNRIERGRTL